MENMMLDLFATEVVKPMIVVTEKIYMSALFHTYVDQCFLPELKKKWIYLYRV